MSDRVSSVLGPHAVVVQSTASVLEAVTEMASANIGAVAVVRDGLLVGMLSERDVVRRVVVERRSPALTPVAEVMYAEPAALSPSMSVEEAVALMVDLDRRHLPVVDASGVLRGVVSMGLLADALASHLAEDVTQLFVYLHGPTARAPLPTPRRTSSVPPAPEAVAARKSA